MSDSDDEMFREIAKNNEHNTRQYILSLLSKPELKKSIYITIDNLETIEQGSRIFYVDKYNRVIYAGIFIKLINYHPKIKNSFLASLTEQEDNNINNIYLLLKLNTIWHKLKLYGNHIFHKKKKESSDILREHLSKYSQ